MRAHASRLHPGDDLRLALQRAAQERAPAAACVLTCVGSLACARLSRAETRSWSSPGRSRSWPWSARCPATGRTCTSRWRTARERARRARALRLRGPTTAEVVLGELDGLAFARELDPATGWRELVVRPRAE